MRNVPISENDGVLFNSPFHPGVDVHYKIYLKEIRRMVKQQGEGFWIQFVTSFRSFATNNGGIENLSILISEEAFIEMLDMLTSNDSLSKFCTLADSLRAMNYAILRRDYLVIMDPILRALFTNYKKPLETLKLYVRFFTSFIVLFQRWQDAPRARRNAAYSKWIPPALWRRPGIDCAPRTYEGYLKTQWGKGLSKLLRVRKSDIYWMYPDQATATGFKMQHLYSSRPVNHAKKSGYNSSNKNVKPLDMDKDNAFSQATTIKEVPKEKNDIGDKSADLKTVGNKKYDSANKKVVPVNSNKEDSSKHKQPLCSNKENIQSNEANSSVGIGVDNGGINQMHEEKDLPKCNKGDASSVSCEDESCDLEDKNKRIKENGLLNQGKEMIKNNEVLNSACCVEKNIHVQDKKVFDRKGSVNQNKKIGANSEHVNSDLHLPNTLHFVNQNIRRNNNPETSKKVVVKKMVDISSDLHVDENCIHNNKHENLRQENICVKNDYECKTKTEGTYPAVIISKSSVAPTYESKCAQSSEGKQISSTSITVNNLKKPDKPLNIADLTNTVGDNTKENENLKMHKAHTAGNVVSHIALKDNGNDVSTCTVEFIKCTEKDSSREACSNKVNAATQTITCAKVNAASQTTEFTKVSVGSQTGKARNVEEPEECSDSTAITSLINGSENNVKILKKKLTANTESSIDGYTNGNYIKNVEHKSISTKKTQLFSNFTKANRQEETPAVDVKNPVNTCTRGNVMENSDGKQICTETNNQNFDNNEYENVPETVPTATDTNNVDSSNKKPISIVPETVPTATDANNVDSSNKKPISTVPHYSISYDKKLANQKDGACVETNAMEPSNISAETNSIGSVVNSKGNTVGQNNLKKKGTNNSKNAEQGTDLVSNTSNVPPADLSTSVETGTDAIRNGNSKGNTVGQNNLKKKGTNNSKNAEQGTDLVSNTSNVPPADLSTSVETGTDTIRNGNSKGNTVGQNNLKKKGTNNSKNAEQGTDLVSNTSNVPPADLSTSVETGTDTIRNGNSKGNTVGQNNLKKKGTNNSKNAEQGTDLVSNTSNVPPADLSTSVETGTDTIRNGNSKGNTVGQNNLKKKGTNNSKNAEQGTDLVSNTSNVPPADLSTSVETGTDTIRNGNSKGNTVGQNNLKKKGTNNSKNAEQGTDLVSNTSNVPPADLSTSVETGTDTIRNGNSKGNTVGQNNLKKKGTNNSKNAEQGTDLVSNTSNVPPADLSTSVETGTDTIRNGNSKGNTVGQNNLKKKGTNNSKNAEQGTDMVSNTSNVPPADLSTSVETGTDTIRNGNSKRNTVGQNNLKKKGTNNSKNAEQGTDLVSNTSNVPPADLSTSVETGTDTIRNGNSKRNTVGQNNLKKKGTNNSKNAEQGTDMVSNTSNVPPADLSTSVETGTDTIRNSVRNKMSSQNVKHKSPPNENKSDRTDKSKCNLKKDTFSSAWKKKEDTTRPSPQSRTKDDGVFHKKEPRTSGTAFGRPLRPPRPIISNRWLCLKCDNCNILEATPDTYKKCGQCLSENMTKPRIYCSRHCQFVDWKKQHKGEHRKREYWSA